MLVLVFTSVAVVPMVMVTLMLMPIWTRLAGNPFGKIPRYHVAATGAEGRVVSARAVVYEISPARARLSIDRDSVHKEAPVDVERGRETGGQLL